MKPVQLTYGNEGFREIRDFLNQNYHDGYTLSIYDNLQQSTVEIICAVNEMVNAIMYVSSVEHDFPAWIGVNEWSDSYVVGMDFTRGRILTPSVCEYNNGKLEYKII